MIHSTEEALEAAKKVLDKGGFEYTLLDKPKYKINYNSNNYATDVWVVGYTYMVFQEEDAFIYLDDCDRLKLMFIMTNHGYITK